MKKQSKIFKNFHLQQQSNQQQQQQRQQLLQQLRAKKTAAKANSLGNLRVSRKTLSRLLIAQFLCETSDYNNNNNHNNLVKNQSPEMASLPQGAFAACKLREQYQQYHERDYIMSRMKTSNADKSDLKADNQKQLEYTPVKYNDKLMNSIWGLYNRYSPHNVKKNEYVPPKY